MNATYTQGDGKWHSEYMEMVKTMPTDSWLVISVAQMALHAKICENPTHPHITEAQDQFDIAERAYDLAEYHKATEACYRGLLMMGGK